MKTCMFDIYTDRVHRGVKQRICTGIDERHEICTIPGVTPIRVQVHELGVK